MHLANIAEDQHHIRPTHAHYLTASAPREGTMTYALAGAREAGIPPARLRAFFANAMVVSVLTAHPTEVRRKSMIDREMEVADLLGQRDRLPLTGAELAANERMYRDWPFFQMLLSNMDMVLAKSDIAIASRYAELVSDTELRDRIFSRLRVEWQSVVDALLRIMGQQSLLKSNPLLARSIRNRFPYLDPLDHMQIELLKAALTGLVSPAIRPCAALRSCGRGLPAAAPEGARGHSGQYAPA